MRRGWRLAWAAGLCSLVGASGGGRPVGARPGGAAAGEAAVAGSAPWRPAAGLVEVPLWPAGLAIRRPETDAAETRGTGTAAVAGRPWTYAANVSRPTMTIYPPRGHNSGAAIMVLPGGGYQVVAMDLEGTEICDWITTRGVTCIVLKYRVPQAWRVGKRRVERAPATQLALQDAQRAMGLIRRRAASLGVAPHRLGVIGFSAGGHLAAAMANADRRSYARVDAADDEPSRPDFAVMLYPGHLLDERGRRDGLALAPWITISRHAPPTLLLHSIDDPVDDVNQSIAYALALRRAKVPVEMHLYAQGGHAFGLRPTRFPITTQWPRLVETWLHTIKVLQARPAVAPRLTGSRARAA